MQSMLLYRIIAVHTPTSRPTVATVSRTPLPAGQDLATLRYRTPASLARGIIINTNSKPRVLHDSISQWRSQWPTTFVQSCGVRHSLSPDNSVLLAKYWKPLGLSPTRRRVPNPHFLLLRHFSHNV